MTDSDIDVLIVGAGPTGTTLALELSLQKDIKYRIIEKEAARSDKSRALAVQPRTLELLSRHGDISGLVSDGTTIQGPLLYVARQRVAQFNIADLNLTSTPFPLPLMVSQCDTEHFLDRQLAKYDTKIERQVIVKDITQDATGVNVALEKPDGTQERIRAKYVVGADGAHSVVRHAAPSMAFVGAQYPQDFVLCDCRLVDSKLPLDRMMVFLDHGALFILPIKGGLVRLTATRPYAGKEQPTLEEFQEFFDIMTPPGSGRVVDPVWITRFRLNHRIVDNYRDGRLFVAGDAGHIHSPAGGQGMNTGIQDAMNLAWKLGRVLRGQAGDEFLDTYNEERRHIGQHLITNTDRLFTFVTWTNPIFCWLRSRLMPWIAPYTMKDPTRRAKGMSFVTQFAIKYRYSSIVGTSTGFQGPVKGGYRLPDGDLVKTENGTVTATTLYKTYNPRQHTLFLFSGTGEQTASGAELAGVIERLPKTKLSETDIALVTATKLESGAPGDTYLMDCDDKLHASLGFDAPGYVLVRPDGYVAHIGLLKSLDEFITFWEKY